MARLIVRAALLCSLAGCGGGEPPAQARPDSAAGSITAPVPSAVPEAESMPAKGPVGSPQVAPAGDTVSTIVAKAFPAAAATRREPEPFPHLVILDRAGRVLGYEAFSDSAGVTAQGYAGTVPLQVFFTPRGRPVRIYILDNCETQAYLDIVYRAGLLDTLLTYSPSQPDSVDAVTLATSSSHAIIAGVTGLAARVAAEIAVKPDSRVR